MEKKNLIGKITKKKGNKSRKKERRMTKKKKLKGREKRENNSKRCCHWRFAGSHTSTTGNLFSKLNQVRARSKGKTLR